MVEEKDAARCDIRVNVIDWTRKSVPNRQYETLQRRYEACGTVGSIGGVIVVRAGPEAKAACQKQVRAQMNEAGHNVKGHDRTMEIVMTPREGASQRKLETVKVVGPGGSVSRTQEEMAVLQEAAGSMLAKLFTTGVCD